MLRAVVLSFLAVALAQSIRLEFDAASIKLNTLEMPWRDTRDNCGLNGMGSVSILPGGRIRAQRALLSCIIQGAYGVRAFQVIGGPDWINSLHYDIDAKSNKADISAKQTSEMLQGLLVNRFKLKLHSEMRIVPIYVLTTARSGSKLRPAKPGSCLRAGSLSSQSVFAAPPSPGQPPAPMVLPCGRMGGAGAPGGSRMDGGDVPISELVRLLINQLHRPVIDRTSLRGTFDIHLTYAGTNPIAASPGDAPTDSGPTIVDALQEQLGLKLESTKGPIEVLVVESVQKPTEN